MRRRARKETTYGQKGGEGPTRGKTATNYIVTLPDGSTAKKRIFFPPTDPVGYAYQHDGKWYISTVAERTDPRFTGRDNYKQCPAVMV
jgi:hypothetical protein